MAETTEIAWCDSTFNPWIGCTPVGPGCDNCYARTLMETRMHRAKWGPGEPRVRTSAANWKLPLKWNGTQFCACSSCGWRGEIRHIGSVVIEKETFATRQNCAKIVEPARRRVFCGSLCDVFDNEVPPAWRRDLFSLIEATPNLDWLLLTKRIGNAARMIDETNFPAHRAWPWPNVWIGATVVNQAEADRDIPKLLATPAAVRFLSIEPMLGPIDLFRFMAGDGHDAPYFRDGALHWVIVGGESGPNARPMHIPWARSIVQQCKAAGVPVLVKQLGTNPTGWCAARVYLEPEDDATCDDDHCDFYEAHESSSPCAGRCVALSDRKGADMSEWPEDLRAREFPNE